LDYEIIRLYMKKVAICFLVLFAGCDKDETDPVKIPVLTTTAVTEISINSAKSGGKITLDGGSTITTAGICWSTEPVPTINNSKSTDALNSGEFVSSLTGLNPGVTYYVRAYATNGAGTGYGNEVSFTTFEETFPVSDFDGNIYNTVRIGNQVWMAENLKSVNYADGKPISGVYAYNDDDAKVSVYGRLYTWDAVMNGAASNNNVPSGVQGACPNGYHVPSIAEWNVMLSELGGESVAGGKLKATGTVENGNGYWFAPNAGATNSSGFSALPGGWREEDDSYQVLGYTGFWWSSTRDISSYSDILILGNEQSYSVVVGWGSDPSEAFSLRCVKN
jgi:uncharacterized protein (TIGR02145 family)